MVREEESLTSPLISSTQDSEVSLRRSSNSSNIENIRTMDQESVPLTATDVDSNDSDMENDDVTNIDAWRNRLIRSQRKTNIIAHVLALLSMMVVFAWIHHLDGLSWKTGQSKRIFNWHPLLMITAFAFMTVASLSFRNLNRPKSKLLHGLCWSVALLCMMVALIAVFRSHNDGISGYSANMYSMHSWVGAFVLLMYLLQFVSGMISFGFPTVWRWNGVALANESFKSRLLIIHQYFGPTIYLGTMLTILLGIQEKEGFVGCAYKVDGPDHFPPSHFFEIPLACRISHLLGLLIFLTGISTTFTLHPFERGAYRRN